MNVDCSGTATKSLMRREELDVINDPEELSVIKIQRAWRWAQPAERSTLKFPKKRVSAAGTEGGRMHGLGLRVHACRTAGVGKCFGAGMYGCRACRDAGLQPF